jgi:hypothetical protein
MFDLRDRLVNNRLFLKTKIVFNQNHYPNQEISKIKDIVKIIISTHE